jgi:hypothetical protein
MSGISEISSISGHKDQPSTKNHVSNGIASKSPNKIEKPNNIQEDSSPDTNISKK